MGDSRRTSSLDASTWTDLDGRAPTLLVPVGAVEQHGPDLPCDTDARVAGAVAAQAVRRLASHRDVVLAPTLAYGASGEHEDFPGTVSIGHEALRLVLVELGRSACRWAGSVVLLNAHGGNVPTLVEAVRLLRREGREVAWTSCATSDADAHAGRTETSLMLHLAPDDVREGRSAGPATPVAELMPRLRDHGVRAVSSTGVLGDPAGATGESGEDLVAEIVERVVAEVLAGVVDETGRLRLTDVEGAR